MPREINEKLRHLTEQEIEDLIFFYEEGKGEVKVADLIKEYKIDVYPHEFAILLPPVRTEEVCEVCGSFYHRNVKNRSGITTKNNRLFCVECGHVPDNPNCSCGYCEDKRIIEKQIKKQKIIDKYKKDYEIIPFQQLSLQEQLDLLDIWKDAERIGTREIKINNIRKFHQKKYLIDKKILTVSPKSAVDAFTGKDFPREYYINKVIYDINVSLDANTVEDLKNGTYFIRNTDLQELTEMYKEILCEDLISQFENKMVSRNLELRISEPAYSKFCNLLDVISYSQISYLCTRVARWFSDKVITGDMPRAAAANGALMNVSKFYERATQSDWVLVYEEPKNITNELYHFITCVFGGDTDVLNVIAKPEFLFEQKENEFGKALFERLVKEVSNSLPGEKSTLPR